MPMETKGKELTQQIQRLITELQQAEQHAQQLLQTARAKRRSFGLSYNYLDEDIAQVIGHVRYMQLMARQWEEPPTAPSGRPASERITTAQPAPEPHEAQ